MYISSDALNQSNPDAVIDTHANAMGCSGVANGGSVVQKMVYCMPVKLHITSRRPDGRSRLAGCRSVHRTRHNCRRVVVVVLAPSKARMALKKSYFFG